MVSPSSQTEPTGASAPVVTPAQLKRERLRFTNFTFTRTPAGLCTAEVELEWLDGLRVVGKASGQSSPVSDLRVAAEAGIAAIEKFTSGGLKLELLGVKALRAFDANIVIVSVEGRRLLLGVTPMHVGLVTELAAAPSFPDALAARVPDGSAR